MKSLGGLTLAVMAMTAFSGSASATSVTTTTGGAAVTPTLHLVNGSGHIRVANAIANIECQSTIEGKVESHSSGNPVKGATSSVSFTGCTNSWHVTTLNGGTLLIDHSSGHNGAVSLSFTWISATRFGVTCNYETFLTPIGTLTGGSTATLDLEASIPLAAGSSPLCGSGNAKMSGAYVTTSALYVAP